MNAPPHEVNITLLESADRDGGRLDSSIKDAKQSPYGPRKTMQRKQHIIKITEEGNPQQYAPKQTQPTVKNEKEEQVYFCLRRKLVKRSGSNEEEECNTIANDRNNFELPEPSQGVAGATETTVRKPSRRNHLSSFSLGQRTKSADWSISRERTRTTDGSIGEGHSSMQRRKAPDRTVSEPIKVERKQQEINVTLSPRRSSPRNIQDCANLEYSTGLEGIELLRQNSNIRLACGSDSKSVWVDQQGFPYSPAPITAVSRDIRWQRTKRSKKHKGHSDGSVASVRTPEGFCQISQCPTLATSSSDLSVVSRNEALDADSEVRRKCYTWYARLGQPNREQMKRRVARMSSSCGIRTNDVDKLAWINNGERISISAMNESLVKTSPRERQEMEVDSCTTEIENSASKVLARRSPSRTKSRRVPARSLSEGLQIISKKTKEQHAGESSYESASTFKRRAPARAVSDSLCHDREARERKHAKKKIERDVLEGLSLQKMLHELKSANISPRRSRSHSRADPVSSEKAKTGPSHLEPPVLEKPKQKVLAKQKTKHSGAQSAEEISLKSRPQTRSSANTGTKQPSQKHSEMTVLDTRPVQALSTSLAPVGRASSGVSPREHKLAGLDGYIAGDRTSSIRCTQLVVGKNGKSLDPIVASFMGLDHADQVCFDRKRKKARLPDFVQALSFFSAKRTTAESSSADTSSARSTASRGHSKTVSAFR